MRRTRLATVVALLGVAGAVAPIGVASAVTVGHFQGVPEVGWTIPGGAPLDGAGGWIYVAPEPAPGPDQMPSNRYEYDLKFQFTNLDHAVIGLTRTAAGPIAGIRTSDSPTVPVIAVPYAWVPGHAYFLLLYKLGPGLWGGWAYDASAGAWTFLGQAQAPSDQGQLLPGFSTMVDGAEGAPPAATPFTISGATPVTDCSQFPRVDAYFYPPMGWRGSTITSAGGPQNANELGDCPTSTTVENGWTHVRIGNLPTR